MHQIWPYVKILNLELFEPCNSYYRQTLKVPFKNQTLYFLNLRLIHYYIVWSVINPPNQICLNSEHWSPIFFNRLRKRQAWTFLINNLMFLLLDTMVHILYNDLKSKKVQCKKAASLKVNVFSKIFMRNIKKNFKKIVQPQRNNN